MFPTASLAISDLFAAPFLLSIPVYQRPYSWSPAEAEQLLDDVVEAMNYERDGATDPGYFFGTILLMDPPGAETTFISSKLPLREFDIVDGQQRLITLMTLLAILRDLEINPRRTIAKRVQAMLTAQQGARFFRTERFRLHVHTRERNFFENAILKPGATVTGGSAVETLQSSEAQLLAVRDRLRMLVGELSDSERARLFAYLVDNCHVVVMVSHDIDRAHRLFVVLNERGKSLQRNDILKADVMSRLPTSELPWANETWDATAQTLGPDFEQFFTHVRTIYGKAHLPIVSGVRAVVREMGGADGFLRLAFQPLARSYVAIRECHHDVFSEPVSRRLTYLNRLADGDWAPAAMLAINEWQNNPARAEVLIREIDRLAYLLRILGAGTGKRVRRFADVIAAIRSGADITSDHPAFALTREETRSIAFNLKDLHTRSARMCKLVLLRVNDELSGQLVDIEPDLYTIEHVLPQRPSATSEWRKWYPVADERAAAVDSLGNLVLITQVQNDKARNGTFAEKKAAYAAVSQRAPLLAVTADVLENESWKKADIDQRELRLLVALEQMFRIELGSGKLTRKAAAKAGSGVMPVSESEPATARSQLR